MTPGNDHFQVLKGHSSAVTHIIVNSDKGEIISAAQDKVTFVYFALILFKINFFCNLQQCTLFLVQI